ncbi:MAG TPA: dihydrofolate reductase family protein [Streptosporangiales bacterium]
MAKLLYAATMSLDGFIAGPGGDMQWLNEHVGPNPLAEQLVDDIGALLVGGNTYYGDDPNRGTDAEGAFGGRWHGPQVVLTHRPPAEAVPDTTFLADLDAAVDAARSAAGDRYVNVLGANVARQCLEAGVLDEILMIVAPVLLGDGVRMFDRPGGTDVRLERTHVSDVPAATNLWYRVVR